MNYREELARAHGFATFAELLDLSDSLPKVDGETAQSYMTRHPNGYWFVWEDRPLDEGCRRMSDDSRVTG